MRVVPIASAIAIALGAALLSVNGEDLAENKPVTVVAKTGKPFGEVSVTVTLKPAKTPDDKPMLATMTVSFGGKVIDVPAAALAHIDKPQLANLRIAPGPGADGKPWLYICLSYGTFRPGIDAMVTRQELDAVAPIYDEAVIAITDGHVAYRSKRTPVIRPGPRIEWEEHKLWVPPKK